jgi:hypothetical protein
MRVVLPSLLITSVVAATVIESVVPEGCVLTADGICEDDVVVAAAANVDDEEKEEDSADVVEEEIPPFEYVEGMSILDVLNPDILEDDDLMDEIRERLHNHDLVVLRDAFVPEFAHYVWQDLERDDLEWPLWSEFADDGFSYSHHNFYDVDVRVCAEVDIDDALHSTSLDNGNYQIGVHIADAFLAVHDRSREKKVSRGRALFLL